MSSAVNVTLEEVPFEILEAVKARILANRRRLAEERPGSSLQSQTQYRRFIDKASIRSRYAEPLDTYKYAVAYEAAFANQLRVYSCNGEAYSEITLEPPFAPQRVPGYCRIDTVQNAAAWGINTGGLVMRVFFTQNNGYSQVSSNYGDTRFCLPAGNDALIYVYGRCSIWSNSGFKNDGLFYDLGSGFSFNCHCFYVNTTITKEIEVPKELKAIIELQMTPPESVVDLYALATANSIAGNPSIPQYVGQLRTTDIKPSFSPSSWLVNCRFSDIQAWNATSDRAFFYGWGPGIYTYLKDPLAADATIDEQPYYNGSPNTWWKKETAAEKLIGIGLPPSLAVSSLNTGNALLYSGSYPPTDDRFPPIDGKEHGIWSLEDAPIDKDIKNVSTNYGSVSVDPIFFWDWSDSDYCRKQLLALGFKSADLQP